MTWKVVNKILQKNKRNLDSLPSEVNVNGKTVYNPRSVCKELNEHFCNIGHKMAKSVNVAT